MSATPSRVAMNAAGDMLRSLASAWQVYGLYDEGHPNRAEVLDTTLSRVHDLADASTGVPVLFVTRHSFYLGPTLLARESLSLYRLVEAFENVGIEAVEFLPGAGTDDLDGLLRRLLGELPPSGVVGGVAINQVRPEVADAPSDSASDLRRGYGIGLDLLRETEVRAGAGRPVDLSAATAVVESLAGEVVGDPGQALLLSTVRSYDEYTYYHMVNVCLLSMALGRVIGLVHDHIVALGLGALLHDVGKLDVPREVLNHVGPLTEDQWRIVQRHPVQGAGLVLATSDGLYHPAAPIILEHHASFDLSGYPTLTGRDRPSLPARIVAVADCFDALTSDRAYRRAEERRQALSILVAGAGRGFDPRVVRTFVRLLGVYPVGSLVRLDSGDVAVVTRVGDDLTRPVVRQVLDSHGGPTEPVEVDLTTAGHGATIVATVAPDELGIDVGELLTTGRLEPREGGAGGLVHEPSPGEPPPPGYVDTHREHQAQHRLDGRPDPDAAPPWPEA